MPELTRTARVTGLFYLCLAVAGGLSFLFVRPRLFVAGDPAATLANLVDHPALARTGVALELLTVLTMALAATWFYRLFHDVNRYAAAAIAAFGLVNAVATLISAALLATALDSTGDAAAVQLLHAISGNLWSAGAMFFGLWLIPMGRCALESGWMPRALGWILIGGGSLYVLGAFLRGTVPDAVADAFGYPATVGELWMVGHLLLFPSAPAVSQVADQGVHRIAH
jgi:hypothetical protein